MEPVSVMYTVVNVMNRIGYKVETTKKYYRKTGIDFWNIPASTRNVNNGVYERYVLFDEVNIVNILDENRKLVDTLIEQVVRSHIHNVRVMDNFVVHKVDMKVGKFEITKEEYENTLKMYEDSMV